MRTLVLFLLGSLSLGAQELDPGVSRDLRLDPVDEPTLLGNLTFQTPAGTQWAIVEAVTESPDQDIDLNDLHENMSAWRGRLRIGVFGYTLFWIAAWLVGMYRYFLRYFL